MNELKNLGPRLRTLRQDRGWTLEELAERAGMSPSTLSRLESGKRQASLELLLPLTRQLGVKVDDLLEPEVRDPRVRRPVIRREGMIIAPLTPVGAPVEIYKVTYPPTPAAPEPRVHDGFEWFYVAAGKLRLRLGDDELVLTVGEAAEFDTRIPHSMSAVGPRPAQVLSIFNRDGMKIHTHTADADADADVDPGAEAVPEAVPVTG